MGSYLAHESTYLEMGIKTYIHILVNMDLIEGLIEGMDIGIGVECIQILGYEGIPFRCRQGHRYGHIAKKYELPFST